MAEVHAPIRGQGGLIPRNKYLFLVAVAALVLGVLQAASVLVLPFGSWFSVLGGSLLSSGTLTDFMSKYGYASLFALMALESASLPIPSEVVLPLAGYFVRQGTLDFWLTVAVSTVASLVGALVDYFLARWLGRPFVTGILRLFRLHKDLLDRAEGWFRRSAQWTVFAARFVPGLRTVISLPAGLFEMSLPRFVVMTTLGCLAWSVILVYAGTLATSSSASTFTSSPVVVQGLSLAVAVVSGVYVVYFLLNFKRPVVELSRPSSVS